MIDERYQDAKTLFLDICDLPADERAQAVAERCSGDVDLRAVVESLLAHHDASEALGKTVTIASTPAVASTPMLAATAPAEARIGPWRVIHELGRGGMGVVYLAERVHDNFRQRAALKILKRGTDTDDVLRRFGRERQLLAMLNHRGIARLYDVGESEKGLPYFAMEYVVGRPLDTYCDQARLSVEARIELFRKVCAAVQYAHQNLVVHRDLKPGNILVTEEGEPKLLDFGIAKIVNPNFALLDGDPTAPEFRVMTPEYASPEQVRGLPISTASDVYALGVILYELITGRRPYQLRNRVRNEIERVVCNEDPERPSTALTHMPEGAPDTDTLETVSRARDTAPAKLRRRVAGDLDNIILKAMRKEPRRRYVSAVALAEDLDRHLRGMPVTARPDTFSYRASKFVGRHRAAVAASGVIGVLLIGGIVGTASGMHRARKAEAVAVDARDEAVTARQAEDDQRRLVEQERDRADAGFAEAQRMARTLMVDFHDAIAVLDGALPARQLLVETALAYLDKQVKRVGDYPELLADLATAYDRVGDLRGGVRNPSLGELDGALESYGRARSLWGDLVARDHVEAAWWRGLARNHTRFGDVRRKMGEHGQAMKSYRTAHRITETLLAGDAASATARWDLSTMLVNIGAGYVMLGDDPAAFEAYRRALALRESVVAESPDETTYARGLAIVYGRLAGRQHAAGELDDALESHETSIEIRRGIAEAEPDSGRAKRDLAMARYGAARVLVEMKRTTDAVGLLEESLPVVKARYADNPTSARAQRDLAMYHDLLASIHLEDGDMDAVGAHAREARAVIEPLAVRSPDDVNVQYLLASSLLHQGAAAPEPKDAQVLAAKAIETLDAAAKRAPEDDRIKVALARANRLMGEWLRVDDRPIDAMGYLQSAEDALRSHLESHADDPNGQRELRSVLLERAYVALDLGRPAEAIPNLEAAIDLDPEATALAVLAETQQAVGADAAARRTAVDGLALEPADPELRARLEALAGGS